MLQLIDTLTHSGFASCDTICLCTGGGVQVHSFYSFCGNFSLCEMSHFRADVKNLCWKNRVILLLKPDSKWILDIFQFHTVLSHDLIRNVFICLMCTGFFIMMKSKHGVLKKKSQIILWLAALFICRILKVQNYLTPTAKKRRKSILIWKETALNESELCSVWTVKLTD